MRGGHSLLVLGDGGTGAVTLALPEGYEKFGEQVAVAAAADLAAEAAVSIDDQGRPQPIKQDGSLLTT